MEEAVEVEKPSSPQPLNCVRAKPERMLFLAGLPVVNARSRLDVLRFWFLTSIQPPCRISQGLDRNEQPLC